MGTYRNAKGEGGADNSEGGEDKKRSCTCSFFPLYQQ